ncbi:unnamed protein product [Didymodactylos carnosus]|uniref:UDP-glucose 4-epimerase n=1 Tax=Didymodactylos carnosus TaxID=1234261 RepID=A0A813S4M1_9BILA|nr:unnamed protein product [Didymodactylos carnosus]CAF1148441.1 unnamed protein product [Didymodactylos carnosus]CAF3573634.1 unnamed protein product [Didymodactylos carnosus]CAF3952288.1 unnamed protein product [Didymodactylos carnosus]
MIYYVSHPWNKFEPFFPLYKSDNQQHLKILVPGGIGYIGSHCVIELVKVGYEPILVDNGCNSSLECLSRVEQIVGKKLIHYEIDILDVNQLERIFTEHTIFAILHLAALKSVGESIQKPLLYYRNNCMEKFGVKNFLFSSSATVYGSPQYLPLDEKHPCVGDQITNPYGKSKYVAEHILKDASIAHKDWNIVILRYFNPVGAHESGKIGEDPVGTPNNLMPYVAQVAVGRLPHVNVMGTDYDTPDGTGVRDYIHVVDLAIGHVAAMNKFKENCGLKIYNLGTGHGYSVLEMIKALEKASGRNIAFKNCPRRPGDLASVYADPQLAAKELNWTAKRGLDEMCMYKCLSIGFDEFHTRLWYNHCGLVGMVNNCPNMNER